MTDNSNESLEKISNSQSQELEEQNAINSNPQNIGITENQLNHTNNKLNNENKLLFNGNDDSILIEDYDGFIKTLTSTPMYKFIIYDDISDDLSIQDIKDQINKFPIKKLRLLIEIMVSNYFSNELLDSIVEKAPTESSNPAQQKELINALLDAYSIVKDIQRRIQLLLDSKWDSIKSRGVNFIKESFAEEIFDQENYSDIVEMWIVYKGKKHNGILTNSVIKILKMLYHIGRTEGSEDFEELTWDFFEDLNQKYLNLEDSFLSANSINNIENSTNKKEKVWKSNKFVSRKVLDEDDEISLENLEFYSGEKKNKDLSLTFDEFIEKFRGNYQYLESSHNYIQVLFPLREKGLYTAQPLSKFESEKFKTPEILNRVLISYEFILDFFGLKLLSKETGKVARNTNYSERYNNFNSYLHNTLRMTRILKFLGIVGLEHFKLELLLHWIEEIFKNHLLLDCSASCVEFWIPTLSFERDLLIAEKRLVELTNSYPIRKEYKVEEETWAFKTIPLDSSIPNFYQIQPIYDKDLIPLKIYEWKRNIISKKRKRSSDEKKLNETKQKKKAKV